MMMMVVIIHQNILYDDKPLNNMKHLLRSVLNKKDNMAFMNNFYTSLMISYRPL